MQKGSEKKFGDSKNKSKSIGKTAHKILDFVISDPSMSAKTMAYKIGISSRAVDDAFWPRFFYKNVLIFFALSVNCNRCPALQARMW